MRADYANMQETSPRLRNRGLASEEKTCSRDRSDRPIVPAPGDSTHEEQDQQNDQEQPDPTDGAVAPAAGVGIGRHRSKQQDDQNY